LKKAKKEKGGSRPLAAGQKKRGKKGSAPLRNCGRLQKRGKGEPSHLVVTRRRRKNKKKGRSSRSTDEKKKKNRRKIESR